MLKYTHFALPNLYLVNGYEEKTRPGLGTVRSYVALKKLENCVARLVLRQPKRLRGWDFRFLRNQLGLSQSDLGKWLDRDAQTIARWEKSKRKVPSFADLVIRCRFAERFDPKVSLREVLSFVDGTAPKLPTEVRLHFFGGDWYFQMTSTVSVAETEAVKNIVVRWPQLSGQTSVYQAAAIATAAYGGPAGAGTRGGHALIDVAARHSDYIEIGRVKESGLGNEQKHH